MLAGFCISGTCKLVRDGFARGSPKSGIDRAMVRRPARCQYPHPGTGAPAYCNFYRTRDCPTCSYPLAKEWTTAIEYPAAAIGHAVLIAVHPFLMCLSLQHGEPTVLDVGRGDGFFVSFPAGRTMRGDAAGELWSVSNEKEIASDCQNAAFGFRRMISLQRL